MTLEELPAWVTEQAEIHADRLNELLDSCLTALAIVQRKTGLRAVISRVQGGGFVNVTVTDAELKVASPYAQMHETSRELKRVDAIVLRSTAANDERGRPSSLIFERDLPEFSAQENARDCSELLRCSSVDLDYLTVDLTT